MFWKSFVGTPLGRTARCSYALLALVAALLPGPAVADSRLTTDLTLNELLRRVVERNEGVQGKVMEVEIARRKAAGEKGAFEPDLVIGYDRVDNKRQTTVQEQASLGSGVFDEKNNIYNAGLEGLVPLGSKI